MESFSYGQEAAGVNNFVELLLLLALLQVKHYYADFVIQTYDQTVRKGIYRDPCGISHSLDHVWTTMVVLLMFNVVQYISPLVIVAVAFVEGIVHYHIDWIKVKFGTKNMHSGLFWNQFGLDQLAHQLTYLYITYFIIIA